MIAAVRAGDIGAWTQIDERYRKRLQLLISTRLPGGANGSYDDEDLIQSTLLSAFKELDSCQGSGTSTR